MRRMWLAAIAVCLLVAPGAGQAADRFITLASTTSTEQSGLFDYLLPLFTSETGIEVRVVAVGTGQALKLGEQGDADALLVHDRPGEDDLVRRGHALDRQDVMFNDFIIVGPKNDPAKIGGLKDAAEALRRIADAKMPFASRGDDSGTNRLELRLWKAVPLEIKTAGAGWYKELGSGMGPTLNTAAALNAYTIADRATWANFKNRQDLVLLADRDKAMFNPYSTLLVNPAKGPHIKAADAAIWHKWLIGVTGQKAIAGFKISGEQLFFPSQPNAAH